MAALCLCPLGAAPDDFRAAARAETRVAAAAQQAGSPAAAEARGGSHVAAEVRAGSPAAAEVRAVTPAAAAARRAGLAEAANYVACPDEIAAGVAAESLADVLAVRAASAGFPEDDCSPAGLAVLAGDCFPAELADDCCPAALAAVLADDCFPAAYQGIGEVAAPAERRMEDAEHYDYPVPLDDHCP